MASQSSAPRETELRVELYPRSGRDIIEEETFLTVLRQRIVDKYTTMAAFGRSRNANRQYINATIGPNPRLPIPPEWLEEFGFEKLEFTAYAVKLSNEEKHVHIKPR